MPKKGTTIFPTVRYYEATAGSYDLRGMLRDPVLVVGTSGRGVYDIQRMATSPGDPMDHATDIAELWTVSDDGHVLERLSLRCEHCGWRANLHALRLWRRKHRKKSGVPALYCCAECKASHQRLPDKRHRDKKYREYRDRDGSV